MEAFARRQSINAGRVISTVEKNARGVLITGFEYTYDILGRVSTEKHLDKNVKLCYTYDERSRVIQRTKVNYSTDETTEEAFTYDAAGNIVSATDNCCDTDSFSYDTNNRLTYHNGMSVNYDADGNMTSAYHDGNRDSFRYDSTNRLIGTNTNAYTYNAENVRIRNLCGEHETTYVYNTNAKLSSMLMKTTDGVVTKYIYGRGLIGEETNGSFKTYHFDYRGSTVAITDINGNFTDRFEYDTYGKLTSRTGTSDVIFLYNGRDGVVTDANGLIYMRARYYSPELRRFINADILAGRIDNAVTLNRYAYANGNPVSLVDPFGLSALNRFINQLFSYVEKRVKRTWKSVENVGLAIDNAVFDHTNTFDNYESNSKNDVVDELIYSQHDKNVKDLKIGNATMGDCGCEVIAVYNARILCGMENVSLADTINTVENIGALTFQDVLNGHFGSNPYAVPKILDEYDMQYEMIESFDDMNDPGVYIVAFWNSDDLDSMLHTIAVEVSDEGTRNPYNGFLSEEQLFVSGYKIEQKTERK